MKAIIFFLTIISIIIANGNYTEKNGQVVIAAADYYAIDTEGWAVASELRGAFRGAYIVSKGIFESRDSISYKVEFKSTGKFYCFIRSFASDPSDNGCFLFLNKRKPDNPGYSAMYFYKVNNWDWNSRAVINDRHDSLAFFLVKEPGVYLFSICVREVGSRIDAVVFKKDQSVPKIIAIRPTSVKEDLVLTDFQDKRKRPSNTFIISLILVFIIIGTAVILSIKRILGEQHPEIQLEKRNIIVDQAKKYIEKNYSKSISLNEIAKAVNLSKSYLRAMFRTQEKMTVNQYLLLFRLKTAHQRLEQNPNENISTIAFDCGFENPSHFTKAFKAHFGYPPSNVKPKNS